MPEYLRPELRELTTKFRLLEREEKCLLTGILAILGLESHVSPGNMIEGRKMSLLKVSLPIGVGVDR